LQVNKLLSCATHHLSGDKLYHFVFCIELSLKFNRTIEESEKSCFREVTSSREQDTIRHCVKSSEGNSREANDEKMARMLRPTKQHYLPWISINDKSFDEMQVTRMTRCRQCLLSYLVFSERPSGLPIDAENKAVDLATSATEGDHAINRTVWFPLCDAT
uniref:Uncharacterized protein n=1 Tax=Parascaris equorum TaxID=6256 RepID=A0A914S141_PAREQ